ncbi:hypothetical protein OROHE_000881 [Orobanche hederae]
MEDNFWVEVSNTGQPSVCKKRKRSVGKRKIEFIGWGSRPLIEFLEAIGKDTTEKQSQHEVTAFINKYIKEKGLASAEKKKKILCDERLYALFGKKSVPRIKIHDMLEEHFAENHDNSDDSSDDENFENNLSSGYKKNLTGQMTKIPKIRKSCFAAVIPENIKLIYLKRSLIQELLKVPESFEFKMVGSFVRMKSDPNDIYQKNRFQVQQVTGVEKITGAGDAGIEVCLRVSNFFKEVSISMLSDDNFSKEEIEDVRDRIKSGLLKRLTVRELEEKVQILHVDITKHNTMFEYLDRRKMLQTPSEQEKLLLKIPEVIAEELDLEVTATATSENAEGNGCSPKSILRGSSDVSSRDASEMELSCSNDHAYQSPELWIVRQVACCSQSIRGYGSAGILAPSQIISGDSHALEARCGGIDSTLPVNNPNGSVGTVAPFRAILNGSHALEARIGGIDGVLPINNPNGDQPTNNTQHSRLVTDLISGEDIREDNPMEKPAEQTAMVIDLSDDESEEDEVPPRHQSRGEGESPDDVIWHYVDPQGQTRGPFPLYMLKRWSDANYFHSGFRVWKSNQTPDDGVLLVDVLSQSFPNSYS